MGAEEVPGQVHVDNAPPPLFGGFEEMQHGSDQASVVYQNLNVSPLRFHLIEHDTNLRAASYIARNRYS
jgi:homoserine kinase